MSMLIGELPVGTYVCRIRSLAPRVYVYIGGLDSVVWLWTRSKTLSDLRSDMQVGELSQHSAKRTGPCVFYK